MGPQARTISCDVVGYELPEDGPACCDLCERVRRIVCGFTITHAADSAQRTQEPLLSSKCRKFWKHPCVVDRHEWRIDWCPRSQSCETVVWNGTSAAHGSPCLVCDPLWIPLFRLSGNQPFFNTAVWNKPYEACDYENRLSDSGSTKRGEERYDI